MEEQPMRGVDAVVRILQREGVEYLFAYPNNPLIDAAAGIGIRPLVARGEKTLVNMADGYARATNGRRPAVVVVQAGPGIENAFGAVAQAHADGIPILLIPGGPDQRRQSGEFDPIPTYRNVTKWAARVTAVERVPELLRRAFSQLRTGQPGPVLLELPRDVGAAELDEDALAYTPARAYRSAGDPDDVAEAARLLLAARRPLVHVGHGVLWAEAWEELRALAELVGAPVMTTMAAKSAFPEDHPLSVGTGGHTISRTAAHFLVGADLVFGIGCSFSRSGFSAPIPPGKKLVQITIDGRDVDRDYPVDLAVLGDARLVLRQLVEEVRRQLGAAGRPRAEVEAEVKRAREAYLREWMPRLTADETPINPYRVVWELMHAVDRRQTIVTHDSGNPRDQTLTFFEALVPRGYLGWGKSTQLGTGYGLALGAKLAHPDWLVVNVMGDLAFGTIGMEVETAVRERLPILTVLLNNSCMGGYGHHMPTASERFGSNRLSGEYTRVAEGLGAYAERVERPGDVAAAIRRGVDATRQGRPVVLEMITKEEPVYPVSRTVIDDVARELQPVG
ncbi:MAG TPA: thiamine pyrophosphate-requiring protein [Chloroflexota bacterium]|nr:thiamine pyrophosphate-requiring protein [Chloroflexota bacterium]